MIGIRQLYRNARTLWGNRSTFSILGATLLNDKLDASSLKIVRRLAARGHSASCIAGRPINLGNDPIPWYTYPLIDFIADWKTSTWCVVEFGSGQSTLYWAKRVKKIVSYENDKKWFAELIGIVPENVNLRFFENLESLDALKNLEFNPDLVVVDGWRRKACAAVSIEIFGNLPIYLLDNSDWFPETAKLLRNTGLTEFRFKGFGPINGYAWSSSLFLNKNSLEKLNSISYCSEVPGGLHPGDTEKNDINLANSNFLSLKK